VIVMNAVSFFPGNFVGIAFVPVLGPGSSNLILGFASRLVATAGGARSGAGGERKEL